MERWRYAIALGSNVPHHRHGRPELVLRAALDDLPRRGLTLLQASAILSSQPLGPSRRRYANAAALVETPADPDTLLAKLKRIEADFGRRPGGQRWGSRVLDLDIILWSGGSWSSSDLVIPHIAFRSRAFVLKPLLAVAAAWKDPVTRRTIAHLQTRLAKPQRSLDPAARPA